MVLLRLALIHVCGVCGNIFCAMVCRVKMFGEICTMSITVFVYECEKKCFPFFYYENISVLCCTTLYLCLVYILTLNVVGVNIYLALIPCCHPFQKPFLITQVTHDWCDCFYTLICYNVISVEVVDVTSEGLILLLMQ